VNKGKISALKRLASAENARLENAHPRAGEHKLPTIFTEKFNLQVEAADEASIMVRNLFYFHLTALLVVALVIGGTSDRSLVLDEGVQLPFYDAGINLTGFYVFAPILLFLIHGNLLVKLSLLRRRLHMLIAEVRGDAAKNFVNEGADVAAEKADEAEKEYRNLIYPFDFSQIVGGPRKKHHLIRFALFVILTFTVYIAPLFLLLGLQARFLAFQSERATELQQFIVAADAAALFVFSLGFGGVAAKLAAVIANATLTLPAVLASYLLIIPQEGAFRLPQASFGPCTEYEDEKEEPDFESRKQEYLVVQEALGCWSRRDRPKWAMTAHERENAEKRQKAQRTSKIETPEAVDDGATVAPAETERSEIQGWLRGAAKPWRDLKNWVEDRKTLSASSEQFWWSSGVDRATLEDVFGVRKDTNNPPSKNTLSRLVRPVKLAGRNLAGANFRWAEMPNADLREANAVGADFLNATLPRTDFGCRATPFDHHPTVEKFQLTYNARTKSTLRRGLCADLRDVLFNYAILNDAKFYSANLSGASLREANLQGAGFTAAVALEADFSGAILRNAELERADLTNAIFSSVKAERAVFHEAKLSYTNFSDANLTSADLRNATSIDGDFRNADLTDASLAHAWLPRADFGDAILANANFGGVWAQAAGFAKSDLTNANLFNARLIGSDFDRTTLSGANLTCARFAGARNLNSVRKPEGIVVSGADFRPLKRGESKRECFAEDFSVEALFGSLDPWVDEDCPEELVEAGLLRRDREEETCKPVNVIGHSTDKTPDWLVADDAKVCAERENYPYAPDGSRIIVPNCEDPDVVRAWHGKWLRTFGKAYGPVMVSNVVLELCPDDRDGECDDPKIVTSAQACVIAKLKYDRAIAVGSKATRPACDKRT